MTYLILSRGKKLSAEVDIGMNLGKKTVGMNVDINKLQKDLKKIQKTRLIQNKNR